MAATRTAAAAASTLAGGGAGATGLAAARGSGPLIAKNGEHIFVYTHLRTRQTIYSLSRAMRNKKALRQLTFVGKKSVPAALRKDVWRPLCVLSFPNADQGLDAFAKLREFRTLHETAYDADTVAVRPGSKALVPKKQKTRILQNQMANSVADMAHVLFMQARPPTEAEVKAARWWHEKPMVETKKGLVRAPDRPRFGKGSKASLGQIAWRGSVKGVKINWSNILDAEFAETWPEDVLHGKLESSRYTAIWPPANEASRTVEEQKEHDLAETASS